jgi:2-keto-3-deoxy-L-rhamnonate aldolase RhmA
VESVEAAEKLEALIEVTGVDGVFLGPHDPTVSMEIPAEYEHPDYIALVEDIIRRCRRRQIGVGLHTKLLDLKPDVLRRVLDAGMNWILSGSDVVISRDEGNRQLRWLRKLTGDVFAPNGLTDRSIETCINARQMDK